MKALKWDVIKMQFRVLKTNIVVNTSCSFGQKLSFSWLPHCQNTMSRFLNYGWTNVFWIILWIFVTIPNMVLSNSPDNTREVTLDNDTAGNHSVHEQHGIHIVSWRWSELSVPILASFLVLAVSLLKVSEYTF